MKYLCLIRAEKMMEQMREDDARQHYREYAAYTEAIRNSGHFVDCNRLLPPETATTVRVRNGRISTTDGPFAETKDLNEAILVAARIPGASRGCVEVRPIAEDAQTLHALGLAAATEDADTFDTIGRQR